MSLLEELKKQAAAKQTQAQIEQQRQAELEAHSRDEVLPKLARIYSYLKELLEQVEILQAEVRADYDLKGCGSLAGLRQQGYELHADSRDNMTHVRLAYYCVGEREIRFELQTKQQVEQQKDYFKQHGLVYTSRDYRDERHNITHAVFRFEPRIPVGFDFHLSQDLATIMLTVHNYEGLGRRRYPLDPAHIDDNFLDELGKYILRRDNRFLKLDISDSFRERLRERLASDEKKKQQKLSGTTDNVTYLDIKRREKQSRQRAMDAALTSEPMPDKPGVVSADAYFASQAGGTDKDLDKYSRFANLPGTIRELKRSELDKAHYAESLEQLRSFPDKLFATATHFLIGFNCSLIKPNKRLELVSAVIGQVYPVLAETIDKYRQQHSLPENPTRREVLLAAITMVEQIAIAYKHVFKADSQEGQLRNQERMLMCSFRILEMVRIEQRLRALRYQKLPAGSWEDGNKVFFYTLDHADINKEFKLLGSASRWVKDKPGPGHKLPSCSIRKLYFSIQLFGLLDITTWPVWLFQIPDQYLELIDDGFNLIADQDQELAAGWLIAGFDQKGPAVFKRPAAMPKPSIIIDYSKLYNHLVMEYEELNESHLLGEENEPDLSAPLKTIHKYDRIPVLESIMLSLRGRERHQQRRTAIGRESFRLYFGFDEIHHLLVDRDEAGSSGLRTQRELTDTLAGRSCLVVDENPSEMYTWEMINFSTGGLLLSTEENDFTRQIEVGQVIAFTPATSSREPLLGCITRVQRTSRRNVELAVFRLSTQADAAMALCNTREGSKELPVILLQDMDGKWKILMPNRYGLVPGTPLQLRYSQGSTIPARLGETWLVKNKFSILGLSSPKLI